MLLHFLKFFLQRFYWQFLSRFYIQHFFLRCLNRFFHDFIDTLSKYFLYIDFRRGLLFICVQFFRELIFFIHGIKIHFKIIHQSAKESFLGFFFSLCLFNNFLRLFSRFRLFSNFLTAFFLSRLFCIYFCRCRFYLIIICFFLRVIVTYIFNFFLRRNFLCAYRILCKSCDFFLRLIVAYIFNFFLRRNFLYAYRILCKSCDFFLCLIVAYIFNFFLRRDFLYAYWGLCKSCDFFLHLIVAYIFNFFLRRNFLYAYWGLCKSCDFFLQIWHFRLRNLIVMRFFPVRAHTFFSESHRLFHDRSRPEPSFQIITFFDAFFPHSLQFIKFRKLKPPLLCIFIPF